MYIMDLYEEFKKYGFTTERVEELKKELAREYQHQEIFLSKSSSTSGVLGKCFGDVL
jgi:hypothetical protein